MLFKTSELILAFLNFKKGFDIFSKKKFDHEVYLLFNHSIIFLYLRFVQIIQNLKLIFN